MCVCVCVCVHVRVRVCVIQRQLISAFAQIKTCFQDFLTDIIEFVLTKNFNPLLGFSDHGPFLRLQGFLNNKMLNLRL